MTDRDDHSQPIANDHEAIRDDLAAYAMGTLDPAPATRLEAHLPTCPSCGAALRDYGEVLTLLPLSLPVSQRPAGARDRLLARSRGPAPTPLPAPPPRRPAVPPPLRPRSVLRLALVATLLLIVTGAGVAALGEFGRGPVPYRRAVAMAGTEAAPNAAGLLVYGWERGELIVSGLPELPPDRSYQLWFVAPDQPWTSVEVFAVDAGGNAAVPVTLPENIRSFVSCDVTEEPAGGSPSPTGPHLLHGEW